MRRHPGFKYLPDALSCQLKIAAARFQHLSAGLVPNLFPGRRPGQGSKARIGSHNSGWGRGMTIMALRRLAENHRNYQANCVFTLIPANSGPVRGKADWLSVRQRQGRRKQNDQGNSCWTWRTPVTGVHHFELTKSHCERVSGSRKNSAMVASRPGAKARHTATHKKTKPPTTWRLCRSAKAARNNAARGS